MNNLLKTLKILYTSALQSDSDSTFYFGVHAYIDLIVKTPVLSAIMEKSDIDYHREHAEIWQIRKSTDYELDYQSELTNRLESLSLYAAHYVPLLVQIYEPLEEYINPSPDLKDRLDPIALLMVKGFQHTERTGLWSTKHLKILNKKYEGKRKEYENHLKQFHADFVKVVEKIEELPVELPKEIPLTFNSRTGDFAFFALKGNLSLGTQEFKVFSKLYNSPDYQAEYLTLLKSYNSNVEVATKSYRDNLSLIIRNLKEKLGILPSTPTSNPDIFKNNKKVGYRLVFSHIDKTAE